ncbi:hypothetical protein SUGI_0104290 [Cryptomeria japonica]|uniref:GATA transcription factor 6-like n=1 Tax=Cryptomeria japonica TaxID=3369 RepID=UPI002408E3FA|nr:GATA transcription factor 6-like [Cryptomeria japonica]GLJ09232.1 hypothetical protein SUGI_0104290 [Cryptomeria japonica]
MDLELETSFFSYFNSDDSTGEASTIADDLFVEFPMADDLFELSDNIIGATIWDSTSEQLLFNNNGIDSSSASLAQLNSEIFQFSTLEEEDTVVQWLREFEEKEVEKMKKEVFSMVIPRRKRSKRRGVEKAKSKRATIRRCMHCATHKTPQWRQGPMGPKTLCNACGVRYRSGSLYPEYRPANSPTFVSCIHSNSHKKVVQMRAANNPQHPLSASSPASAAPH